MKRLAWVITCLAVAGYESWVVFVRETPALTIQGHHIRKNELTSEVAVAQLFQMVGNDLSGLEFQVAATPAAAVFLRCELSSVGSPEFPDLVHATREWVGTLRRNEDAEWSRITFPPIAGSNRQIFRLRLQLIDAVPADASPQTMRELPRDRRPRVAFVASADNVVGGGELRVGDHRQDGSLSMRAYTERRTAFARFKADVVPTLPPLLRNSAIQLAIVIGYQWALVMLILALLTGRGSGAGGNTE